MRHVTLVQFLKLFSKFIGTYLYLFIIYSMGLKNCLKCLSSYNIILKYADDTIRLVPKISSVSVAEVFARIADWSRNKQEAKLSLG